MINDTEPKVKHLTIDNIKDGCITVKGSNDEETKLCIVQEELRQGIDTITQFNPSVTFYCSARLKEDTEIYQKVNYST